MTNALSFVLWLLIHLQPDPLLTKQGSATLCTAFTVYTEARGEPWDGQVSVAQVVTNRTKLEDKPACAVVFEPSQFSGVTGEIKTLWAFDARAWHKALTVTVASLHGEYVVQATKNALFFHNPTVTPRWSKTHKRVAIIGRHSFYR